MGEEILNIENLNCFYERVHVLKGIDFKVCLGEIVCIVGSNGAGKSTTLKSISGLNRNVRGKIWFRGDDLSNVPPYKIVELGVVHVPERRRIFSRLTVRENLLMGAYLQTHSEHVKKRFDQVFSLFPRLGERMDQKGGTLSGGEQQMLAIGRGLMTGPRLMLLDEPSLGLAPIIVGLLFKVLEEIKHKEVPLLLVEQNAHMALKVSNRGYVLETGNIVLQGSADELKNNEKVKEAYLGRTSGGD